MAQLKKTILIAAISGVGHVNACAGATLPLVKRGHRVIFLLDQSFEGKFAPLGFEEHIYQQKIEDSNVANTTGENGKKPGEDWATVMLGNGMIGPKSSEDKFRIVIEYFVKSQTAKSLIRDFDSVISEAIAQYKPDLIWMDAIYLFPSIYASGIPWVHNMSNSPLINCDEEDLPPGCSGYPTYATKDEAWRRFKEYHQNEFIHSKSFNDHLVELGHDRYPHDLMIPDSESMLTIYAFPDELVYPQLRTKRWFNLEVFNKNQLRETVDLKQLLPESFLNDDLDGNFSGKWVYLSMGSMGSVDLTLMRRIVEALAETNHKYIVSKGPRHAEYDLPRNAWGDRYLPQTKLVPLMDLVITHGGNNTVTETFAHGKPMIVLPLFGDQYDNAQRLHECGFGIRINPYEFDKVQMIEAVNKLLYNHSLKQTLQNAAERIQSSRKHDELALMVEALLEVQKS